MVGQGQLQLQDQDGLGQVYAGGGLDVPALSLVARETYARVTVTKELPSAAHSTSNLTSAQTLFCAVASEMNCKNSGCSGQAENEQKETAIFFPLVESTLLLLYLQCFLAAWDPLNSLEL